ncbi:glycoside-pentoside-hexuronide (GPH):cation symporter [Lactobacillus helveticus]|uniref:PTS sugar transporter subunit IIA n=1 Tax=Lactobacillus helveticus TaxID=1587 RepID=UPI00081AA2FD|nr:PTS sugar transporter subunit IIA [Lactobacillus helveticus]ANZ55714.1 phosphotransferase enzyme IIA component [Lactobacillus helveticus]AQY53830.1 phosphotransferase enzyme IIA component [Lactobacillus helveticus]MBW1220637.1 glycoside-pentoside-hexuronide (GPH):cation symporter [Lactobacillus helveticus]MDY0876052.1 glycoside-pentoside-hexuronide (GPH):cation symporter [Lactobacillus helveticus]URN37592.1 glycoside-pentoside-hexuronide (GPH):cation symporter [Lactobacillus helveticus]
MHNHKVSGKQIVSYASFCLGNLGHSAFYGVMSTYFIIFITSGMFSGLNQSVADKLVGLITGLMVLVRIIELVIDPILGNVVDNTKTRWGKFKPWILIGTVVSAALLLILFTGIFGLAQQNWILFAILFVLIYIAFDVFYSLSDVSYWGMVPALSEDSHERGIYTSLGAFSGTIGWNSLPIIVVPLVTGVTYAVTGKHEEGAPGWFAFAAVISALAIICALIVCFGTKEKHNIIRNSAKQKTTLRQVFGAIFHNDQILWPSLAYLFYSLAAVITNGVLFYMYKFVIGKPNDFWVVGVIATIIGCFISPSFPVLNKYIPRKWLFIAGQTCMVLAYVLFIFGRNNVFLMDLGLVLFNINFALLVTVLTLTDAIEYGQLKIGQRNEAVVLAVRPMIDKFTGAVSNALVGYVAIAAGMTGSATAADMTSKGINTFNMMALYIPLALAVLSIVVFLSKVTLSEKKHAQVIEELKSKLAQGEIEKKTSVDTGTKEVTIYAPADGELMQMSSVVDEDGKPFPGKGFAIEPSSGQIYAPFDGTIKFTFGTKHAFEIVSQNGLQVVVHVGLGTVNLRGEGFETFYDDGQTVKKGDKLLEFDRDLALNNGYKDTIVIFYTQPGRIQNSGAIQAGKDIKHGEKVVDVQFK